MSMERIKYIAIVCLIAFVIWLIGQAILVFCFPNASMTVARLWVVLVFGVACGWSMAHFIREDNRKQEEEDNDNYKGVY